jgi:hypothetical protein
MCRGDVYPKGGGSAYALNNPHNMQTIFKHGQLLASFHMTSFEDSVQVRALGMINSDSILSDIQESLTTDKFAQEQITMIHARSEGTVGTPTEPSDFSLTPSGLLMFKKCLYIPDARNLWLCVLQDKHDHPSTGHMGYLKTLNLVR